MKNLLLFLAVAVASAFGIAAVLASGINWLEAEDGVAHGQSVAYAGCAPARARDYLQARKAAILKAQANFAKHQRRSVSGEEHAMANSQGETIYKVRITETAETYLRPVKVVEEEITHVDGAQQLCVLVMEEGINHD